MKFQRHLVDGAGMRGAATPCVPASQIQAKSPLKLPDLRKAEGAGEAQSIRVRSTRWLAQRLPEYSANRWLREREGRWR